MLQCSEKPLFPLPHPTLLRFVSSEKGQCSSYTWDDTTDVALTDGNTVGCSGCRCLALEHFCHWIQHWKSEVFPHWGL